LANYTKTNWLNIFQKTNKKRKVEKFLENVRGLKSNMQKKKTRDPFVNQNDFDLDEGVEQDLPEESPEEPIEEPGEKEEEPEEEEEGSEDIENMEDEYDEFSE
jgi:hypothetical protein